MNQQQRARFIKRYMLKQLALMWKWYPLRKLVKYGTVRERRTHFECRHCGLRRRITKESKKMFDVDHVQPVGDTPPRVTWERYIDKKLPKTIHNLQLLCKRCHMDKTDDEVRERTERRRRTRS